MKWLDYSVNAKNEHVPYVVEIGADRLGDYNLPAGLKTRTNSTGKVMTILPAKHLVADERDCTFGPEFVAECDKAFGKHPLDILNDTGLDLLSRKNATDQYRKEGAGVKVSQAATTWAAVEHGKGNTQPMLQWLENTRVLGATEANAKLIEQYQARPQ